jgi:hypothetical protein
VKGAIIFAKILKTSFVVAIEKSLSSLSSPLNLSLERLINQVEKSSTKSINGFVASSNL